MIFKGGTSLSKVYQAIQRFSEDIDLSLSRDYLGFGGAADPEQQVSNTAKKRARAQLVLAARTSIRDIVLPQLHQSFEDHLGVGEWALELQPDDEGNTLNFSYPIAIATSGGSQPYLRSWVKIEIGGRGDHEPCEYRTVRSYVADIYPQAFKAPDAAVKVLAIERTFWEKATILHAEFHRPPDKQSPERHSRHYYDLYRLIQFAGLKPDTALLARVATHKKLYFESAWAQYDDAKRGTLRLSPHASRLTELRRDYDKMQEMFFPGASVPFDKILETLSEWEKDFNTRAPQDSGERQR